MVSNGIQYDEISRVQVNTNRNVIVSKCSAGGYTIAQQIVVNEDGAKFETFLKGAIRIKDKQALQNLKDALEVAIDKIGQDESQDKTQIIWDKE